MSSFIHLNVHSEFSLCEGIVRIKSLIARCAEFGQPAVAITDVANLYGLVKFYKACLAGGIKPIIGCDVWVESPENDARTHRLTLLCKDNSGYRNLCNLLTEAYLAGTQQGRAVIAWNSLRQRQDGLVCILDDQQGPLADMILNATEAAIPQLINHYQTAFGDRLYLSVSRVGFAGEQEYIQKAVDCSLDFNIALVATNRVVYLNAEDFEAHEIRVCINEGRILNDSRRPRNFTDQQYFRSGEEMCELFKDLPVAISNTLEIAKRCNMFLDFSRNHLPDYPSPDGQSEADMLRESAQQGLARRLGKDSGYNSDGSPTVDKEYLERLGLELDVIEQMGFSGYFLIVADFIRWSRENGIPVGPGRGSGAGSLVAWSVGITELDPLEHGLIFERFLNPERVSLPDFDIDFCVEGRDRVIEYVAQRYGQNQVAQIITFGTMAAKAVVRDVGRVMGLSYGFVDRIAKLIPFEVGITLNSALQSEVQLTALYEQEGEVRTLIDAAQQLEGIARNVGKHAGGVVIAPKPLTEFTPLYADRHLHQAITQFDKDDLESVGLVKFDFLGLRTLTIINEAVKMINQMRTETGKTLLDIDRLPLDDEKTYKFIQKGSTTAVFQLESRGMKSLIIKAVPQTFEDLVALIALFRPGPLQSGMVEDFVKCKAGKKGIKYLHPQLKSILSTTYGVILYQEQVMKIAQILAGYTLGSADLLRKAMGKKLPEEMEKQREKFITGAVERGVRKTVATQIFELMDKFAGYGFNKSHSAAYALISYQTGWLKTHYSAAFMAATLTAEIDNTDKVVILLADCKAMGITIRVPHINDSFYSFNALGEMDISYGLGAIKGVGKGVVENITVERDTNGKFSDLFDLCHRLDLKKLNKRVLEALIKSGSMDCFGVGRATLMASIPKAMKAAGQQQHDLDTGQCDIFGMQNDSLTEIGLEVVPDWSKSQRLTGEKETLGLYLTGHPFDLYASELNQICDHDIPSLDLSTPRNGIFAGIIADLRTSNTRKGKMAFAILENSTHRVELRLFSDKYTEYREKLEKDKVFVALGEMKVDEISDGCQLSVEKLFDIKDIRAESLIGLELLLNYRDITTTTFASLQELLLKFTEGQVPVRINYTTEQGCSGLVRFDERWKVIPEENLIHELKNRYGINSIKFYYDRAVLLKYFQAKEEYPGNFF